MEEKKNSSRPMFYMERIFSKFCYTYKVERVCFSLPTLNFVLFSCRNRVFKLIINEQTTTFSSSLSRLDYCGIALLIMGSFVPWLYYGFYCHYQPKVIYLTIVIVLGFFSIVTSLWDKFSTPQLRPVR